MKYTPKQIQEGNKLISIFMGVRKIKPSRIKKESFPLYSSDWRLLIPVIERIFILRIVKDVNLSPGKCSILLHSFIEFNSPLNPNLTWNYEIWSCIIQFLQYHYRKNYDIKFKII
jgi:hypothetical protein